MLCFQNFPLIEAIYLSRIVQFYFNKLSSEIVMEFPHALQKQVLLTNSKYKSWDVNFYSSPRLSTVFDNGPDSRTLSLKENKFSDKHICIFLFSSTVHRLMTVAFSQECDFKVKTGSSLRCDLWTNRDYCIFPSLFPGYWKTHHFAKTEWLIWRLWNACTI